MGKDHSACELKSYRASWLQSLRHTNLSICLATRLPWAKMVCFPPRTPGASMAMPHAGWIHRAPKFCLNFPTNLCRSSEGLDFGVWGGPPPLSRDGLQPRLSPSSASGPVGPGMAEDLSARWGLLQAKCRDLSELELVKTAVAGGIFGLTAPGLCCRSDYLRWKRRGGLERLLEAAK